MSKENSMNVKFYNYRVVFQSRGAGHIHGVLWLDFNKRFIEHLGINESILKQDFRNLEIL